MFRNMPFLAHGVSGPAEGWGSTYHDCYDEIAIHFHYEVYNIQIIQEIGSCNS